MPSWYRQLHLELLEARIPTSSHRHIVTQDKIRLILTPERVHGLLIDDLHVEPVLADQHTTTILDHAVTILAILVCIGRTSSLLDCFIFPRRWDRKLPLGRSELPALFADQFLAEQHHFLAPTLVSGLFAEWGPETILPFALDEPIGDAEGGFSTVHRIEVIPQYQELVKHDHWSTPPIYFARKELKAGRRGGGTPAFQREKHTLDMLNLVRHPHIVPLLASYIHHDRFNMIFPLADADLAAFLDGRSGVRIVDDALWQGVLGITSAIATLHDFRYTPVYGQTLENIGYHHDLKPRNILVKDSSFFLADFGLARLKATGEDSGTENKHGTATYGAPETQRQGSRIMFSRALDVWSWGCIILEILTFILLSSRGVHDFRSHRSTESGTGIDYYFHNMVEMKPEVEQWAGILRDKALSHDYRRKDLLIDVLGIAKAMLASDPASRPRASETLRKLQAIFAREGILQDAAEAVAQPNMTARTPAVLPESSVMAGNILENLADILDSDHPLMRAVRRSVNSDEQG